jgi:hypothetical protein
LNPKIDLFDGLDNYINAKFHKLDTKKEEDSTTSKGDRSTKNAD